MRASLQFTFILTYCALVCVCAGCHTPAPDSGYLQHPELMKSNDSLPFDAVWSDGATDWSKFDKVYVAEVNSDHLLKMSWWDKLSFAETTQKFESHQEVKVLAKYFQDNLRNTFSSTVSNRLALTDVPDDKTLLIELAIVEVVPTKVWLNSFSYLIAGALDTGATAIEGRFRDGKTKEVIFRFKDKRAGPYSIVNVGDLTWYSHAKDTISIWSKLIEQICNRKPEDRISSPTNFTLRPW